MAKPRSPILGYNHNVRYRGLVLHVQTEDSGISNPHVFTHLFHGGVILQTRKLVYDASASEEAVKALMQAQHKAVLKDLKRGLFDDKMDQYLGGTPGLLPRGQGVDGGMVETPPEKVPAAPPPLEAADDATTPTAAPEVAQSRVPTPVPTAASIAIPPPTRNSTRMAALNDSIEARAPTERLSPDAALARGTGAGQAPSKPARRDVSDAFDAIMVADAAQTGGMAESDEPVIEIRSAPPPSAPTPPGLGPPDSPGAYAQHSRRGSERQVTVASSPPPPGARTGATDARRASTAPPPARPGAGPLSRPPPPMARPPMADPTPPPPNARPVAAPLPSYPSGRPVSPAPPVRPGAARTRSPSGGGVVVTRPAVIVGAPARTVGGNPAPPAASPPPAAARPPGQPPRVRKAREDSESGVFGQDLISEKSLDEVILAYLSEDSSDD